MSMNLDQALGYVSPALPVSWTLRDLLLYSSGISIPASSLHYLYEHSSSFRAFPTYPLVLGLKGDNDDVTVFGSVGRETVPGMPVLNLEKLVHASQSIECLKELPRVSGKGWTMSKQLVGIKDTGKGLIITTTSTLLSPSNEAYTKLTSSSYFFGNYKAGGFNKSLEPASAASVLNKKGLSPTHIVRETTSPDQAIIYRLSGDYNPLHIEPSIGKEMGFPGAILHGLSSYGFCARHLLSSTPTPESYTIQSMFARFTSPVLPGDELITKVWYVGEEGRNGERKVEFEQYVRTGEGKERLSMGGGVAVLVKRSGSSKL